MKKFYTILLLGLVLCGIINAKDYKRIVSLAPSITESIYFVGAENKLVGCTSYCKRAIKDGKSVVASVIKINTEALISLKPDLVFATNFTNVKDVETIKKFGIDVITITSAHSFDEICTQFSEIGALVGKSRIAQKIIEDSRRRVDIITNASKALQQKTVFFQIGADPLFTVTPNTFMNDYITFLHCKNIAEDLKKGSIGREFVLNRDPDYIFIVTMGIVGEDEEAQWRKFPQLKSVKSGNMYVVKSEIACIPTPTTFAQALEYLYGCIKKIKNE